MIRYFRASRAFMAAHADSDFVTARGFTHQAHIDRFADRKDDPERLAKAVESHGLLVARQYTFRFRRPDNERREITLSHVSREQALEVAERRLHEQYGDLAFVIEQQKRLGDPAHIDPAAQRLRDRPDLHQSNYVLVED